MQYVVFPHLKKKQTNKISGFARKKKKKKKGKSADSVGSVKKQKAGVGQQKQHMLTPSLCSPLLLSDAETTGEFSSTWPDPYRHLSLQP